MIIIKIEKYYIQNRWYLSKNIVIDTKNMLVFISSNHIDNHLTNEIDIKNRFVEMCH